MKAQDSKIDNLNKNLKEMTAAKEAAEKLFDEQIDTDKDGKLDRKEVNEYNKKVEEGKAEG